MIDNIVSEPPYVGPRAFQASEQDLFFGRDWEASQLLSLIVAHPVVLFYAASGCGKTSLLNTKLIAEQKPQEYVISPTELEVFKLARVRGCIPKEVAKLDICNVYMFHALLAWAQDETPADLVSMSLSEFLARIPHRINNRGGKLRRVLVFDQFEELFLSHPDHWPERKSFFEQINDALAQDPMLRVVFSLREEYLARLEPYSNLIAGGLNIRFRLESLRKGTALDAVRKPLETTKYWFGENVAESLVDALSTIKVKDIDGYIVKSEGEFVEPLLLQVVCNRLWNNKSDEKLVFTKDDVDMFGDVTQALMKFYEDAIYHAAELSNVTGAEISEWCERELITSMGTRGAVFYGADMTAHMPNQVVKLLEEQRLLCPIERPGGVWYELIHDGFIKPIQELNRPQQLKPTSEVFTEEGLDVRLHEMAHYLCKYRKLHEYLNEPIELILNRFYGSINEVDEDIFNAHRLFIAQLLDGSIKFSRQIKKNSYSHLEGVWLNDVKQFEAYLLWEDRGSKWDPVNEKLNYYAVCDRIRQKLLDPSIKASRAEFEQVRAYLEDKYLDNEVISSDKINGLIRKKAYRIWEVTGEINTDKNWADANKYVELYYGNIIPAVTEKNRESTLAILQAFSSSNNYESKYLIVNSFEVAVAIYFLDNEVISALLGESNLGSSGVL